MTNPFSKYTFRHLFVPLFIGQLLYFFFAKTALPFFGLFAFLQKSEPLTQIQKVVQEDISLPDFMIYQVPDALWAYALCATLLWIWRRFDYAAFVAFKAFLICVSYEFLQKSKLIAGTFDYWDIMAMAFGCLLAYFFTKKDISLK